MGRININVSLGNGIKDGYILSSAPTLITSDNHRATVPVVVLINEFGADEAQFLWLHFFLAKEKENGKYMSLYIGTVTINRYPDCDIEGANNLITEFRAKNVPFPENGEYKIEVYMENKNENGKDYDFKEVKKRSREIREVEELVAFNTFDVVFPDSQ